MISKPVFVSVFVPVFILVTVSATVITFILPEYYAGTARVRINGDPPAESAAIRSDAVLKQVVDKLNLNVEWGKRYNNGIPLKTEDSIQWLKACLTVRPEHDASLIDVTICREDRMEAARIANAIA